MVILLGFPGAELIERLKPGLRLKSEKFDTI